ncbi:rod shape-determining protein MreC [Alkaliphilus hydrothermalis]|uniref:Cell shape-determining protein MreC n=1 Tax=Alkaliphilus hydrothermalis TaxID=1482730 RepID=A0ABS2NKW8_9FIRM|nr:rod shape-determining protein MreC [Alkaliphilus hydrothermalis]MBM7613579.1 rod shape-determining protein MreC [Alkaliphilus hydrothermalis]
MARKGEKKDRSAIIIAIVAIVLIIVMGVTAGQREKLTVVEKWVGNVISPIQRGVSAGASNISEGLSSIFNFNRIKKENVELQKQVIELEKEITTVQLVRDELEELRELKFALNYIEDGVKYSPITANVIAKTPGNWFNIFTINAGEKHGITTNSIVMAGNGLIGRVYELGDHWAKVVSIIDNNSSISFQVQRDADTQGILTGSITNELSGYLFDPLAEVVVGDKLITSGLGNFPKGIPIGEVIDVAKSSDQLLITIKVQPAVNFNRMGKVIIMTPDVTYE